jgi:hypothetical protein
MDTGWCLPGVGWIYLLKFLLKRVASLSNTIAIEQKPTERQLLEVFLNKDDIEKIITTPVRSLKIDYFRN